MSLYLGNAFSLQMLPEGEHSLKVKDLSLEQAQAVLSMGFESAVGHADTAELLSGLLKVEVPAVRVSLVLKPGDQVLVGQYSGPRLPEGTKTLPEGARFRFVLVSV